MATTRRLPLRCLAALAVLMLAGVAQATAGSEEDALRARAAEYWAARTSGEKDLRSYYPPAYEGTITESVNVSYTNPRIEEVEIDGDSATVKVRAKARFALPPQFARLPERMLEPLMPEQWLRIDGVWYREPVRGGLGRLYDTSKKPTAGVPPAQAEAAPQPGPGAPSDEAPERPGE